MFQVKTYCRVREVDYHLLIDQFRSLIENEHHRMGILMHLPCSIIFLSWVGFD